MQRLLFVFALLALTAGYGLAARPSQPKCKAVALGKVEVERIATWRDDARGAYSIVHDGVCSPDFGRILEIAVPELDRRDLRAGLAATVVDCERPGMWSKLKAAAARGHEIVSQSVSHVPVTPENAAKEVTEARTILARNTGHPITFYAFPYDQATPATIKLVEAAGYRGARGGNRDDNDGRQKPPINSADPGDDFTLKYDVWPRAHSKYTLYDGADLLNVHVWNAIESGGWAMRELYSILLEGEPPEAQGFGPVSLDVYKKHLDFLVEARLANQVWIDTPTTILNYRHARKACKAVTAGDRIRFDVSNADCARFAAPLTVILATREDLPSLRAKQGGESVPVRRLSPGRFAVTADPTRGDVLLSGCAQPDPSPAPRAAPVRPKAAASVCDISRRVGPGGWWPIDDFERDEFEFRPQELPQWSMYPGTAEIRRVQEPGSQGVFFRFSGSGLNAWSGTSFMFTSREGGSMCQDVSPHKGIRFRIRGVVDSPDEFAGKVFLALLTAETRAHTYGGDLEGEGGHFNRLLEVTKDWQKVEVPWSTFNRPGWGATVGLEKPALTKVQGFDWSVTGGATRFEIDLDDIELF